MECTKTFITLVVAVLFMAAAVTATHAATQSVQPCPQSFSVAPGTTYTCSFQGNVNLGVPPSFGPAVPTVSYNLSSSSTITAAIVAEQYLQMFQSNLAWASFILQGSGTLANQSFFVDTDVLTYVLVVQNTGTQSAKVTFTTAPVTDLLPSGTFNVTVPPGSNWCIPISDSQGASIDFLSETNATANFTFLGANGQPIPPGEGNTMVISDHEPYQYIYLYPPGNYMLQIANPHPYPLFATATFTPNMATGSGAPCGSASTGSTNTSSTTTAPTTTSASMSSTTATISTTTTTITQTEPPTTTLSVSTVTVTATPPNTLASPALLVAVAALVVAVVLAAYVFLGRRGASGGGGAQAT